MSRKVQVVESDDVIGANHKVEIISKAERVQENPLRLGVLESDLVTFLFFYEEQCELSVWHLGCEAVLRGMHRHWLDILSATEMLWVKLWKNLLVDAEVKDLGFVSWFVFLAQLFVDDECSIVM